LNTSQNIGYLAFGSSSFSLVYLPKNRPRPLQSTQFPIHYSQITLQGAAIDQSAWQLLSERFGFRIPAKATHVSLLQKVQIDSGAQTPSHCMGTAVLARGYRGRGVILATHFHPAPRLRISGAIRLLPPAFLQGVDRNNFTFT
jgi:hypothetical protein